MIFNLAIKLSYSSQSWEKHNLITSINQDCRFILTTINQLNNDYDYHLVFD